MAKRVPPDLSNATPEMLIDEMAKLSIIENYVKWLRGIYKEAYYARAEIDLDGMLNGASSSRSGDTFIASTVRSDPARFDTTSFKVAHPELYNEFMVSKGQLTTRFTLREGVVNPTVESLLEQMKKELDLDF